MDFRPDKLQTAIARLDALLAGHPHWSGSARTAVQRWRGDAAATRFHLRDAGRARPLVAVLGGTGTGKSTLVNRLLGTELSATSFRRTFTAGPVAVARDAADVPEGWLGVQHMTGAAADLPARGRIGELVVVHSDAELAGKLTLVDTPDLDGDEPAHHAQADRAFRWARGALFVVTPEKYQMTELLPYYRLARRYELPVWFVMNKCEEDAVLQDYRKLLAQQGGFGAGGQQAPLPLFVVPRDDAAYDPPAEASIEALRRALGSIPQQAGAGNEGLQRRAADLLGRFSDQVIAPLREDRRQADALSASLRFMETPAPGVDVNPLTQQLQRRLQQRSILYLMGPQRVLDRVRQAPALMVRLPRLAWDYVARGEISPELLNPANNGAPREVPDFAAILSDQLALLHSRIDDVLRSTPAGQRWLAESDQEYQSARVGPDEAARIAQEELAELKLWLEKRWNATPRDTRALNALLKRLPGGSKLARWSEAAPYLLTVVLVTHHAFFGPVDLLVLGGYGLATWLTEKLSNEVAGRTRATNARIAQRFTRLAHEQIARVCAWLEQQAPPARLLAQLARGAEEAGEAAGL